MSFIDLARHAVSGSVGGAKGAADQVVSGKPKAKPAAGASLADIILSRLAKGSDTGALMKQSADYASAANQPAINSLLANGARGADTISRYNQAGQQLLGGIANQVGGIYDQGIATQGAISKGIGDSLAAQNPNAQDQALIAGSGAPAAAGQQVANQNQLGYGLGGAVAQGVGQLDKSSLVAQKAGALAYANQLPALVQESGAQALGAYGSGVSADLAKILATEPALAQKMFGNLLSGQNDTTKGLQAFLNNQGLTDYRSGQLDLGNRKLTEQTIKDAGALELKNRTLDQTIVRDTNLANFHVGELNNAADANLLKEQANSIDMHRIDVTHADALATLSEQDAKRKGFSISRGKDGTLHVQPNAGYKAKVLPDGTVITTKIASGGVPGYGGLTAGELASVTKKATDLTRKNGTSPSIKYRVINGVQVPEEGTFQLIDPSKGATADNIQPLPVKSYQDALNETINVNPFGSKAWSKKAAAIVNSNPAYNTPGKNGRPYPVKDYRSVITSFKSDPTWTVGTFIEYATNSGLFPDTQALQDAVKYVWIDRPTRDETAKLGFGKQFNLTPPPGYGAVLPTQAPTGPVTAAPPTLPVQMPPPPNQTFGLDPSQVSEWMKKNPSVLAGWGQ